MTAFLHSVPLLSFLKVYYIMDFMHITQMSCVSCYLTNVCNLHNYGLNCSIISHGLLQLSTYMYVFHHGN